MVERALSMSVTGKLVENSISFGSKSALKYINEHRLLCNNINENWETILDIQTSVA